MMKKRSMFIILAGSAFYLIFGNSLMAQPEFRSDVQKEYDEDGNITRYDSCWSWSYQGQAMDSVFKQFFRDHPFAPEFGMGTFPFTPDSAWNPGQFFDFPDSAWGIDSWFDHSGYLRGIPHRDYLDSIFSMPFPGSFPDRDYFGDFFRDYPFPPDFGDFFEEYMDRMQRYLHQHPFPDDSIRYFSPGWQHLPAESPEHPPGHQKNSVREIEI